MADNNNKKFVSSDNLKYVLQQLKTKIDSTYSTMQYVDDAINNIDFSLYATKSDLHSHSNKSVLDGVTSTKVSNWDSAYTHSQSSHAPSNAQKNSDITKAEIEAKLTGNITTHTHSQYLTSQDISGKANSSDVYTKSEVESKIAGIVNSAPETLDTLNELAAALGNDPNFATTVATQIGTKADKEYVDENKFSGNYNDLIDAPTKDLPELLIVENEVFSDNDIQFGPNLKLLDYSCGLIEGNTYIVDITNLSTNNVITQETICISGQTDEENFANGLFFEINNDEEGISGSFTLTDKVHIDLETPAITPDENSSYILLMIENSTNNGPYSISITQAPSVKKLDEKYLPNSIFKTKTLRLNPYELEFVSTLQLGLVEYERGTEFITKIVLASIIEDEIETIIFEKLERYPYKVVGAYKGFNQNEHVILERAIADSSDDAYTVHRLIFNYSDDYGECFLKSYYRDLSKSVTKEYVDDAIAANNPTIDEDELNNIFTEVFGQ